MIYVVQKGDTLASIAKSLFGQSHEYCDLANHNGISNPHMIREGQVLKLHRAPIASTLTPKQKIVNIDPSDETLARIQDLFCAGFCTEEMAYDIYRTAINDLN